MLCPCCGEELPLGNWPSTGVRPTPRVRSRQKSTHPNTDKKQEYSQTLSKRKVKERCSAFPLQCIHFSDVEIIHKFRRLRWQMFLTSVFSTAVTAFKWLMLCVPRDFCHLHTVEPSSILSTSFARPAFCSRDIKGNNTKKKKRETVSPSCPFFLEICCRGVPKSPLTGLWCEPFWLWFQNGRLCRTVLHWASVTSCYLLLWRCSGTPLQWPWKSRCWRKKKKNNAGSTNSDNKQAVRNN